MPRAAEVPFAAVAVVFVVAALAACGGGGHKSTPAKVPTTHEPAPARLGASKPMQVTAAKGPFRDLAAACEAMRGDQQMEGFTCEPAHVAEEWPGTDGASLSAVTLLVVSDIEPTRYCALLLRTASGLYVYEEDNLLCEDSEFREIDSAGIKWAELGGAPGEDALVTITTTARIRDEIATEEGARTALVDGSETRLVACTARDGVPVCAPSLTIACDLVACGHVQGMTKEFSLDWLVNAGTLEIRPGTGDPSPPAKQLIGRHTLP